MKDFMDCSYSSLSNLCGCTLIDSCMGQYIAISNTMHTSQSARLPINVQSFEQVIYIAIYTAIYIYIYIAIYNLLYRQYNY